MTVKYIANDPESPVEDWAQIFVPGPDIERIVERLAEYERSKFKEKKMTKAPETIEEFEQLKNEIYDSVSYLRKKIGSLYDVCDMRSFLFEHIIGSLQLISISVHDTSPVLEEEEVND